ncbi:MAG: TolC family protein [Cyclobacteriaceae bacterium]
MKLKIIILLLSLPSLFSPLIAQDVDYNSIIMPKDTEDMPIEEKLVLLAWQNNPENKILLNEAEIAKQNFNVQKISWLNNIVITGNVNQFVIEPSSDDFDRAAFFPLYNIGASLPLGTFFIQPKLSEISKLNYLNTVESINSKKLQTRSIVLSSYQNYLLSKELLDVQTEITSNAYNDFIIIEEEFKNGEVSLEEYKNVFSMYKSEQMAKLNAAKTYNDSIIRLEELIGVPLNLVIDEN